jgi:hypothetical protein
MKVAHGSATLPFPVQIVVIILPSGPPQSYVIPHLSFFFIIGKTSVLSGGLFLPRIVFTLFLHCSFFCENIDANRVKKAAVK